MIVNKFAQLNTITDIWEPHYNGGRPEVYIATWKVKRSKLDIKLRFPKVSDTSEFAGDWFIRRKAVLGRKKFNNNGMECYVVPWSLFEKLEVTNDIRRELW